MIRNWRQDMPTVQAYWINRVLFDVHHVAGHFERYQASPDAYLRDSPLPDSVKAIIRDNLIGQMYLAGANPYLLRAHCLGLRISEIDFLASLRAVAAEADRG
ncbi:MAG: subunit of meta cleavage enzyme [Pseudomonadota bacterium]